MKRYIVVISQALLLFTGGWTAFADESAPSTSSSQDQQTQIQTLKQMIESEEQAIKDLKTRLEALEKSKAAPAAPQAPQAVSTQPVSTTRPGVKANLYGYIEATGISDTSPLFPDELTGPFYALSSNDPAFKHKQVGDTTFTAQYSRVGLDIRAPETRGGWKPTAKFEIDFNGSVTVSPFQDALSRSQQGPRLRLAYARLTKNNLYFELGQDWEAIRQNVPVVFTSDDPFLDGGEVGYRRPLIRAAYAPKTGFQALAEAGLMDALSNADLDSSAGDVFRSGPISTHPLYELRLGYAWPSRGQQPYTLSLWGARGWESTAAGTILGMDSFNAKIVGADFTAPITDWFQIKGKAWTGSNLADFRGGIGQGVNSVTGQEIAARGGWLQAGFGVTPHYWIWIGDSVDNPLYEDLVDAPTAAFTGSDGFPNARARNSFFTLTQIWNIGPSTDLGLEYFYHNTYYVNAPTGVDSRVQVSAHQYF